jgi:hypothetical protein
LALGPLDFLSAVSATITLPMPGMPETARSAAWRSGSRPAASAGSTLMANITSLPATTISDTRFCDTTSPPWFGPGTARRAWSMLSLVTFIRSP